MARRIDIGRGFAAVMNHPEPGPGPALYAISGLLEFSNTWHLDAGGWEPSTPSIED